MVGHPDIGLVTPAHIYWDQISTKRESVGSQDADPEP